MQFSNDVDALILALDIYIKKEVEKTLKEKGLL